MRFDRPFALRPLRFRPQPLPKTAKQKYPGLKRVSPVDTIVVPQGAVTALALSPDGRMFASGSNDASVRLGDTSDGDSWLLPKCHTWGIAAVSFAPSGTFVASISHGVNGKFKGRSKLFLRDLVNQTGWLETQTDYPFVNPTFSPDSRLLAVNSDTISLFDVDSHKTVDKLDPAGGRSLAFSPDGRYLVSGHHDGEIHVWDVQKKKSVKRPFKQPGIVCQLAFSPDGKVLVSASTIRARRGEDPTEADHKIRFWEFASGKPIGNAVPVGESTACLAVLPDGKRWLAVDDSEDSEAVLVSGKIGRKEVVAWSLGTEARSAAVSAKGKLLATGDSSSVIRFWDLDAILSRAK